MGDNPAQRLHAILLALRQAPDQKEREKDAWKRVLEVTDTDELLRRIAETSALIGDVDRVLQTHPGREHYMGWAPRVWGLFSDLSFPSTGRVQNKLDDLTMERLGNCAVRISEMDLGPTLAEEERTDLVEAVETVRRLADENTELDDEAKGFVIQQCDAIRDAVQAYRITGNRGLKAATEGCLGRWFTNWEVVARVPDNVKRGIGGVIARILTKVATQTGTKKLQEFVDMISAGGQ